VKASIHKRQVKTGVRYDVRYRVNGRQREKSFKKKVDAVKFRATVEADPARGDSIDDRRSNQTVAEFAEAWFATLGDGVRAVPSVGAAELNRLSALVHLYSTLSDNHSRIQRALTLFEECDDIKPASGMWLLAHFSTLEALLTHKPKMGDPADSLGRQLRTSVPLLLRRATRTDLLESLGPQVSFDTAMKKLYDLRSLLTHGGWQVGEEFPPHLTVLGDYGRASGFVRGIVKAVLAQALEEPELALYLAGPTP